MKTSEQPIFSPFLALLALTLLWFSGAAHGQKIFSACKPVESSVLIERIHVQCEVPVAGGFRFFAAPTSEPKFANRALSVMLAAQLSGATVYVFYDPKDVKSGPNFGCAVADCRPLLGIAMAEGLSPPLRPDRCTLNPSDVGCPNYCRTTFDISCPGFCKKNPTNADCVIEAGDRLPRVCLKKPELPLCKDSPGN